MRLLYINTFDPYVERHGGAAVTRAELEALRLRFHVDTVFGEPLNRRWKSLSGWRLLRDTLTGGSLKVASYGVLHRDEGFFSRYDAIWCNHDFSAYDHETFTRIGVPFFVRKHNAEHKLASGRGWFRARESRALLDFERRIGSAAEATFHISAREALEDNYSRRPVLLKPLFGIDPAASRAVGFDPDTKDIDVLCVSNFDWPPNRLGIEWFLREVVPLLGSEVSIHLAGIGSERYGDGQRVVGHGFVEDPSVLEQRCKMCISPVLSGAGVKIKTLSALAAGLPLVATAIAVDGLEDIERAAAIADTPDEFAAAIQKLLSDPPFREALGRSALSWARVHMQTVASWLHIVQSAMTSSACDTAQ